MTLDLSKVPHLEERKALLAKLAQRAALLDAREQASAPFEERRLPLIKAHDAACQAGDDARTPIVDAQEKIIADANAIIAEARGKIGEANTALYRARDDAGRLYDEAAAPIDAEESAALAPFEEKIAAFDKALFDELGGQSHPWELSEGDDYIARCVLTGLPLRDDDETLEDDIETGGKFLRAAVPFPVEEPSEEAKALAAKIAASEAA